VRALSWQGRVEPKGGRLESGGQLLRKRAMLPEARQVEAPWAAVPVASRVDLIV
jgi:hypothetical protein